MPPQAVGVPFAQTRPASTLLPVGTQAAVVAQAAPVHGAPLAQGGCNGPPHCAQMFVGPHDSDAWLHAGPVVQQGCPAPPQPAQAPVARQRSPLAQVAPAEMQVRTPTGLQHPVVQLAPPQHGCPG